MKRTTLSVDFISAATVIVSVSGLIAQVMPVIGTPWQAVAFIAVIALQAWQMYLTSERDKVAKSAIQEVASKSDDMHGMLNGHLGEYKRLIAENNEKSMVMQREALEAAMKLVRAEGDAKALADRVELDKRIAVLESSISVQAAQAPQAPTPVTIVSPDPLPVKMATPEGRLGEIRGETK